MSQTAADIAGLVRNLVVEIVDDREAVEVTGTEQSQDEFFIEISVAEGDVGKVIGRQGRIIKAIRTLARAAASQSGAHAEVELAE